MGGKWTFAAALFAATAKLVLRARSPTAPKPCEGEWQHYRGGYTKCCLSPIAASTHKRHHADGENEPPYRFKKELKHGPCLSRAPNVRNGSKADFREPGGIAGNTALDRGGGVPEYLAGDAQKEFRTSRKSVKRLYTTSRSLVL